MMVLACLNVRSLLNKTNDVVEIMRDRRVDVFCLTETWHDADSVCINRLRAGGYNVVDRPRPRVSDDLSVNHGGVAIVSSSGIPCRLSPPSTPYNHVRSSVSVLASPVASLSVS